MTDRPWESEPDSLDFEADGLPCVMRRHPHLGTWCGYVGVGEGHPLFGLPTNHLLKLPAAWFEGRRGLEGTGPMDFFMHILRGNNPLEACEIGMALQVHGGVNYAEDSVPGGKPDGRWWFGFDCGHAGDYLPHNKDENVRRFMDQMVESMPKDARGFMRDIVNRDRVYRDQQYVVSECQSLAAQLLAVVPVIERTKARGDQHDR
jgi:hypothetical protein